MKINSADALLPLRFIAPMMRTIARLTTLSVSVILALASSTWSNQPGQSTVSRNQKAIKNWQQKATDQQPGNQTNRNQADQKLIISANLVNVTVTVEDAHGRFVSGLTKDHFDVFDNKVKQEVSHFSDEDAPLSLGIVFDVSRSMKDRMGQALRALKRFIETSHSDDDLFLITFNDRASLAEDFTTSGDRILNYLRLATPGGSTALYDATYLALEKIQQGRHSKKAILIISDGEDNKSRYNARELRDRVKESDTLIYAIGLTDVFSMDSGAAQYGRFVLTEITRTTGGRVFFPNAYNEEMIVEICGRIALELRRQYSIGFYPTGSARDGKWHRLQVKVKSPKGVRRLYITHKEGYRSLKQ